MNLSFHFDQLKGTKMGIQSQIALLKAKIEKLEELAVLEEATESSTATRMSELHSTGNDAPDEIGDAEDEEGCCGFDHADQALWYPDADASMRMKTRGNYPGHYPLGAVVHTTVGRFEKGDRSAEQTISYGQSQGHCYFCISRTGKIYQTAPLDAWGNHAGVSKYAGLGSFLSQKLVGIEVVAAGKVKKVGNRFEPWWNRNNTPSTNTYLTASEVRYSRKIGNVTSAGYYHRFSVEQEEALTALLLWLDMNGQGHFSLDNVLGHDEIAVNRNGQLGRKSDPGGALSMQMEAYRQKLKGLAAQGFDFVNGLNTFNDDDDE
jgi:N-acetyl-anhydromuramyl-L-alanine amidase AmpD